MVPLSHPAPVPAPTGTPRARADAPVLREELVRRHEQECQATVDDIQHQLAALEERRAKVIHRMDELAARGAPSLTSYYACIPRPELPEDAPADTGPVPLAVREAALAARQEACRQAMLGLVRAHQMLGLLEQRLSWQSAQLAAMADLAVPSRGPPATWTPRPAMHEGVQVAPGGNRVLVRDARGRPPVAPVPTERSRAAAERRVAPRRQLAVDVTLESESNFFSGFVFDLSEGGLFVATYDPLEVGQRVDVDLKLPDGTRITAPCVVRWVRDPRPEDRETFPGAGLQFLTLEPAALEAVRRFTKQREPLFYVS